jgi:TonB family protein
MLDLILKVTLLLAMGLIVTRCMSRASAASRHAVWAAMCVAVLLLPVVQSAGPSLPVTWWPEWFGSSPAASGIAVTGVEGTAVSMPADAKSPDTSTGWPAANVLAVALWMLGVIVVGVRLAQGHRAVARLARRGVPASDARVLSRASLIVGWLGVPHVRILDTRAESMPATCGLRRPVVLLPSSAGDWSDARLDTVLVHECAHVQRRDALWLLVAHMALMVWWWHPLMWLALRQMRVEREHATDDIVLAFGARASDYATDLVEMVGECDTASIDAAAAVAMARRTQLEGRVMAILNPDVNRNGRTRLATAVAVALVMGMAPLAALRAGAAGPLAPATAAQGAVRAGREAQTPIRIKHVAPKYPQEALDSKVQGIVIIEALINTNGEVAETKVLRPVALLSEAAEEAVRQWRYMPTELNGQRVPVIITVTVSFRLGPDGTPLPEPPPVKPAGDTTAEPPVTTKEITWNPGDPPLRIGGQIKEPRKVTHVNPVYPPEAQSANVQGIVILEIRIDQDGQVTDARILRPVALLDQAALDAVLQWEFEPTLLNGQPVPVIMTVTVNFTLK